MELTLYYFSFLQEMDEVELSLSQAESKYDEYVEMCRNLRDENQHLKDDLEGRSKEQAEKIIEIRKGTMQVISWYTV